MSLRTLLDEALPIGLFPFEWRGLGDGKMLDAFEASGGGLLVTCDRNIRCQQTFGRRGIGLIVLPGQRLAQLVPLVGLLVPILRAATVRDVVVIERDGRTAYHTA